MNGTTPPSRRNLSVRRMALLATTIAVAAAFFAPYAAPKTDFFAGPAHAQNLSQQAQQRPQKPVGFADIVEKVKPAVISVRVKVERPAEAGLSNDDLPFPPVRRLSGSSSGSACPTTARAAATSSSPARVPASSSPPMATP
jgi:serine protease Do